MIQFDQYFSNGLVQPPPRHVTTVDFNPLQPQHDHGNLKGPPQGHPPKKFCPNEALLRETMGNQWVFIVP